MAASKTVLLALMVILGSVWSSFAAEETGYPYPHKKPKYSPPTPVYKPEECPPPPVYTPEECPPPPVYKPEECPPPPVYKPEECPPPPPSVDCSHCSCNCEACPVCEACPDMNCPACPQCPDCNCDPKFICPKPKLECPTPVCPEPKCECPEHKCECPKYDCPKNDCEKEKECPKYECPKYEDKECPKYECPKYEDKECPKYECPKCEEKECPKYECPKCEEKECPEKECPKHECPECPKYECPKCPKCEEKECPPPPECPPPQECSPSKEKCPPCKYEAEFSANDAEKINGLLELEYLLQSYYTRATAGSYNDAAVKKMVANFKSQTASHISALTALVKGQAAKKPQMNLSKDVYANIMSAATNRAFTNYAPFASGTNTLLGASLTAPMAADLSATLVQQLQGRTSTTVVAAVSGALAAQRAAINAILLERSNTAVSEGLKVSDVVNSLSTFQHKLNAGNTTSALDSSTMQLLGSTALTSQQVEASLKELKLFT